MLKVWPPNTHWCWVERGQGEGPGVHSAALTVCGSGDRREASNQEQRDAGNPSLGPQPGLGVCTGPRRRDFVKPGPERPPVLDETPFNHIAFVTVIVATMTF